MLPGESVLLAVERLLPPSLPMRATMDDGRMAELVDSLRDLGLLYPLIVVDRGEKYEIVDGHRRYLAIRQLRWSVVRCSVYQKDQLSDVAAMLHANREREQVNPAEEAVWMRQVRERLALDEDGLCKAFHCTPNYLGQRFALLRGDQKVFNALLRGAIGIGVAEELNKCESVEMRLYYLDLAIKGGHSRRMVRQWILDWRKEQARNPQQQVLAGVAGDAAGDNGSGDPSNGPGEGAAGAGAPSAGENPNACSICGGGKDPWNITWIPIHRHELELIQKTLRNMSEGDK